MITISLIFIFISLSISVICYLATSNIIFSAVLLLLFVLYYVIFARRYFKKYISTVRKVHSCYFFINSFIVSLSVKESIKDGLESGLRIEDKELHLYTKELEELSDYEKVKYLRSYFNLSIFKMFLNILDIYQEQGGNILTMSENLIRETTRVEKNTTESTNIGIKHLIEFIVLWSLSFAVILFMKFGINEFYEKMLKDAIFAPLIFVYFLLCLASLHLFVKSFTNLSVKEDVLK